jgi:hypothetical protein
MQLAKLDVLAGFRMLDLIHPTDTIARFEE